MNRSGIMFTFKNPIINKYSTRYNQIFMFNRAILRKIDKIIITITYQRLKKARRFLIQIAHNLILHIPNKHLRILTSIKRTLLTPKPNLKAISNNIIH